MSDIKTWGPNASDQNSLGVPDSAPENATTVADLNDVIRELQAAVRRHYDAPEWRDLGHTPTFVATDQFSVGAGEGASYIVGQRIRITDATTFYGTITNVSGETVTVAADGADVISGSISAVAVGADLTNNPLGFLAYLGNANTFTAAQTVDVANNIIPLVLDRGNAGTHIDMLNAGESWGTIQADSAKILIRHPAGGSLRLDDLAQQFDITGSRPTYGGSGVALLPDATYVESSTNRTTTANWVTHMTLACNITGTAYITGCLNVRSDGGSFAGCQVRIRRGTTTIGEPFEWENGSGAARGTLPFLVRDTAADGSNYTIEITRGALHGFDSDVTWATAKASTL